MPDRHHLWTISLINTPCSERNHLAKYARLPRSVDVTMLDTCTMYRTKFVQLIIRNEHISCTSDPHTGCVNVFFWRSSTRWSFAWIVFIFERSRYVLFERELEVISYFVVGFCESTLIDELKCFAIMRRLFIHSMIHRLSSLYNCCWLDGVFAQQARNNSIFRKAWMGTILEHNGLRSVYVDIDVRTYVVVFYSGLADFVINNELSTCIVS